jgi:hypothetical protein
MTTDLDRTALLEFTAAAYVSYALRKEPTMKTHEQIICENPQLVRDNLAAMTAERDGYLGKMTRARVAGTIAFWQGKVTWANKMIARYEDDLRIIVAHEAPDDPYLPHSFIENGQRMMRHDVGMYCEFPDCTGDTCQDCGAPIPDEGDYCHDCAQEHVPAEVKAMSPFRSLIALAALALSLTTHTASAGDIYTPTSPHNDCTDTGEITEFGGPILDCDGTLIYQDMDGQIYESDAGYPVYEPGTWVTLTYP